MSDELDAFLAGLTPEQRAALAKRLVAAPAEPQGSVTLSNDARINGVAVGINLGRIVYGRDPEEDERRRLVWYLDRLASKLYRLPLRGLDEKLDQGKGMSLPQVYVMLAVSTHRATFVEGPSAKLAPYFEDNDLQKPPREAHHIDHALPPQAIVGISREEHNGQTRSFSQILTPADLAQIGDSETLIAWRRYLASEVILRAQRPQGHSKQIILLGDPGSGKSTFVRHLAWALARRGLDQLSDATALFAWNEQRRLLPIIVPLRLLAGRLATEGVSAQTVYNALLAEIQSYNISHADDMLSESLHRGATLLLFDGLDEVPIDAVPGVSVDRRTTLSAIQDFIQIHATTYVVLTCRVRALDEELRTRLDWPVATIAPFTLGQIRHFIPAWYQELVHCGQVEPAQAEQLSQQLLDTIISSPKLRDMAANPLLLTMMALVLYNKGVLPRDRPLLYERILELLLGQWDKVRDGQSLAETIGMPDWGSERIRPLLDQLSFHAHAGATSTDGRGRLERRDVRDALERFFIQAGMRDDQAAAASVRCLEYFNHRSGLLVPDGAQDSYTFAHLTLQEHSAGRALVLDPDAAALIMRHRSDDRWREPIMLGLGVAQQSNPALLDRVLSDLIDSDEGGTPKPVARYQRDLIFAAEIGQDRDWGYLRTQRVNVDRLQRDLRRGLVALLADKAQPLPVAERVRAGFLLGDLGDPRFPVTLDDWRRELAKVQAGDISGYFCRVEAGSYIIGSTDDDPDAQDDEKPQHTVTFDEPFWISRYPITNIQWQTWVQQGGEQSRFAHDSDLNHPNLPVIGITWHWCNEYCSWLSEQLDIEIRLPTEFEWEASARGGDGRPYPWGKWQDDRAATGEDQGIRNAIYTVPVGCYPTGESPCGGLDLIGNVWEWTKSIWVYYPNREKQSISKDRRVLRGGRWDETQNIVRCSARILLNPNKKVNHCGFRVIVWPKVKSL